MSITQIVEIDLVILLAIGGSVAYSTWSFHRRCCQVERRFDDLIARIGNRSKRSAVRDTRLEETLRRKIPEEQDFRTKRDTLLRKMGYGTGKVVHSVRPFQEL